MYETICDTLLSIIPNIRWDAEGCKAIYEAVKILKSLESQDEL